MAQMAHGMGHAPAAMNGHGVVTLPVVCDDGLLGATLCLIGVAVLMWGPMEAAA